MKSSRNELRCHTDAMVRPCELSLYFAIMAMARWSYGSHQAAEGSLALHGKPWAIEPLRDGSPAQSRPVIGHCGGEDIETPLRRAAIQLEVVQRRNERGLHVSTQSRRLSPELQARVAGEPLILLLVLGFGMAVACAATCSLLQMRRRAASGCRAHLRPAIG